jgi:hypothetical protein
MILVDREMVVAELKLSALHEVSSAKTTMDVMTVLFMSQLLRFFEELLDFYDSSITK